MHHRTELWFGSDGDYVIWQSLQNGQWVTHATWMIPGTQLED
ncbi:hypothetical protein [Bradyrhizobium sp. USDA 4350]